MKVFIVSCDGNYDQIGPAIGVYTSRELADACLAEYRKERQYNFAGFISEIELDAKRLDDYAAVATIVEPKAA